MKLVAVLALLCCFTISVLASPVPEKLEANVAAESVKETGRQAVPVAPAAPASDEDDDDDDDDDDVDLDITGDDDDDEEEDDDEEDDDYLERFIEDILGGEDDDDDDDDNAVEAPAASGSPVVQQAAPAPAIPAAVQADLHSAAAEEAVADEASADTSTDTDTSTYEDDETADVVPEGQAAATIQEASVEGADSIASSVVLNQIPAVAAPAASSEDDDDDDDDDDDVDLDITEDDDDDDDEEEDDDDDDDDDDVVGDIADARKAREFKGKTKKHTNNMRKHALKSATHSSRMMDSPPSGDVSAIYVSKYNRFVDNILGRINKILRANYDPVTVKLTNPNTNSKSNKNKSKKKKSSKRKSNKKGTRKSASESAKTTISDNDIGAFRLSTVSKKMEEDFEGYTSVDATTTPMMPTTTPSDMEANKGLPEITTIRPVLTSRGVPTSAASGNKKKNKTKNKNKTKIATTPSSKPSTSSTNSNKNKAKKNKPKAKATLYGLASLQRSGDVSVNMMSDHTTIKTKFSLGPLMLKVEKEFGRAAKKELRSATATTAEMSGKLSLRVLHGGAATLHSIRVLQPKQVRVESADDHDRTREFVWKRSSHIAHLVSQKLSSATRSMLRPPPVPVPAA